MFHNQISAASRRQSKNGLACAAPGTHTGLTPKVLALLAVLCISGSSAMVLAQSPTNSSRVEVKDPKPAVSLKQQQILHLLNRITYGPRPGDVEDVEKMGTEAFIQQQLQPETIQLPNTLTAYLASNEAINAGPIDLFRKFSQQAIARRLGISGKQQDRTPEQREQAKNMLKDNYVSLYTQSAEAKLRRAVESPRQLEEVMVDFWFNHFNVSNDKGLVHLWVGAYEQQAIRPYALGKFRNLVEATAHHPAMLFYLDNWQNTKPGSEMEGGKGRGNFKGLNENYARELMELHTLGVDGGYSQQDVIQLARILTGLGLPPLNPRAYNAQLQIGPTGSVFDQSRHDFGDKQLLGVSIQGRGEGEIEQAITILCKAPATAHHISYQMAQYFVADEAPKSLVDRLAVTYEHTDGDIKAMMTELLHSHEFWDTKYENAKFKNPYRYVISSLRAANVSLTDYKPVLGFFRQLGMPLYGCLTPDGYKTTQEAWLSPDSLLKRIQFATGIGTGKLPNNPLDPLNYKDVSQSMRGMFTPKTLEVVASSPAPLRSSVLLGSPEFMNY
jgi:uncharacterized protein (DUF1800 family)